MRLTIGRLAEITGVPASAIRFWERHGLLPEPERQSGQRRYPPESAERIMLLRKCQQAGMTLADIAEFQQEKPRRQSMVRAKLVEIEQRMIDLEHAHQLLVHSLQCSKPDILACPTFKKQIEAWRLPSADADADAASTAATA